MANHKALLEAADTPGEPEGFLRRRGTRRAVLGLSGALAATVVLKTGWSTVDPSTAVLDDMLARDETSALHRADDGIEDHWLGSPDADVAWIEYASLTCAHCAVFHLEGLPYLEERYIDVGRVRFVFRHFILNAVDAAASMMLRHAPRERFFETLRLLFETQRVWATAADPLAALGRIALQIGLTQHAFEVALRDERLSESIDAQRVRAARQFGVSSTPSMFINGRRHLGVARAERIDGILAPMLRS